MSTPAKTEREKALAVIATGDKALLTSVSKNMDEASEALAKLRDSIVNSIPPVDDESTPVEDLLRTWNNTINSFVGSLDSMRAEMTARLTRYK